jgi:hypothetical protein
MPTSVACPKCARLFHAPPELLGKRLRCLQCQYVFAVSTGDPPQRALQSTAVPLAVETRIQRSSHDVPSYLWPLAALPWALLVLALGGCIWGVAAGLAAAALFAFGLTLVQARQLSVGLRLAGLLALNGIAASLIIVGGVVFVIGLRADSSRRPADGPNRPIQSRQAPARHTR